MNRFTRPKGADWVSSLVVFIIAIPLSLGIALASGAPPAAGLITAIAGGIIAGSLAGAPLSVTGPAAGLTAIVFQLVQEHGLAGLAIITVMCGLIQLAMGAFRTGRFFTLIPTPVLEGVLSAIGVIIVLGQLHILVGSTIPGSPVQSVMTFPGKLVAAMKSPVLFCGLLSIAIQIGWNKIPALKKIPAALPAVLFVTLLSSFWVMPRVEIAPLADTVKAGVGDFFWFKWVSSLGQFLIPALGLAVVASAESLLTARAIDVLVESRPGFKPCNLNRELMAQGAANLASGIIGGLPMTGVMVRSAANVNAGGSTRWSTILHGVWIALFVIYVPEVLTLIPLTALAAVLILTGVRLINFKHFLHVFHENKLAGLSWFATTTAVFSTDLLKGLVIGIGVHVALRINTRRILDFVPPSVMRAILCGFGFTLILRAALYLMGAKTHFLTVGLHESWDGYIPMSFLAVALIGVGLKLIQVREMQKTFKGGNPDQMALWVLTIAATLAVDLVWGILTAVAVRVYNSFKSVRHQSMVLVQDDEVCLLKFVKDVTFVHKSELKEILNKVPSGKKIVIDGTGNIIVDSEIEDWLLEYQEEASVKQKTVVFKTSKLAISKLFKVA